MALKNLRNIQNSVASFWQHMLPSPSQTRRKYSLLSESSVLFETTIDRVEQLLAPGTRFTPNPGAEKLQHVIYELFNLEICLLSNINKLIYIFQKPMLMYRVISQDEAKMIFGNLESLAEIHFRLIEDLASIQSNGIFSCPAKVLMNFINSLEHYEDYCLNMCSSKRVIKKKMKTRQFVNFIESERVREYSQRTDLNSLLDQPRRHLMKYPLLIAEMRRQTQDHAVSEQLQNTINCVQQIIQGIDEKMGERKCQYVMSSFQYTNSNLVLKARIESSCRTLVLQSDVFQHRRFRPKLRFYLMDKFLVVTRQALRGNRFLVLNALGTSSDLFYSRAKKNLAKSQKHRRPSKIHRNTTTVPNNTALRLYSSQETSFDYFVKFRTAEEVTLWLYKLRKNFRLQRKSGSFSDCAKFDQTDTDM